MMRLAVAAVHGTDTRRAAGRRPRARLFARAVVTGAVLAGTLGLLAGLVPARATPGAETGVPSILACPVNPSAPEGTAARRWASPPAFNVDDKAPAPCAPCSDPANAGGPSCLIFRFLHSPACAGGQCGDAQGDFRRHDVEGVSVFLQYDRRYRDTARYPRAAGENCRFVLWASSPVTGIEDVAGYAGQNYWRAAYVASQTLVAPPFARNGLALAIQPATTRSQHQFHIHIGTLSPAYLAALAGLAPDATQVTINGFAFRVRSFAVPPGSDPFTPVDVFATARDMLPNAAADLPRHGIIAALTDDGRKLWVLVAEGLQREQLNYVSAHECHLR